MDNLINKLSLLCINPKENEIDITSLLDDFKNITINDTNDKLYDEIVDKLTNMNISNNIFVDKLIQTIRALQQKQPCRIINLQYIRPYIC